MITLNFELISLVSCFLLSGFFSGSEAVLMSIGIDRARQIIDQGGTRGNALRFMTERPSELLTTILVGNNVANILAASMTTTISSRYFENDALSISVGITTFIILVFGEIIPKTFARTHAEALSVIVIRILQFNYYLFYPLITFIVWFINRVLGNNAQLRGRLVTRNDIEYMINKAEKENSMDSKQIELISSVLEFPSIKVKDIMIPRSQIKFLNKDMSYPEILEYASEDEYSRYPVCDGDLENTIGFLHLKDLTFIQNGAREKFKILDHLKPQFFVYEHMKINSVFDHMNKKKTHLSLVKDENGIVVGIITLEDIVEEILGEIHDEHDDEELVLASTQEKLHSDTGLVLPGSISLRDLDSDYDVKIPLNDNYSTLAGFVLDMLGNSFPENGQIIVWEGFSFELISVDEFEIKEVRVKNVDGEKHIFNRSDSDNDSNNDEKKIQKVTNQQNYPV
jgi:putative hemolysin